MYFLYDVAQFELFEVNGDVPPFPGVPEPYNIFYDNHGEVQYTPLL